MLRNGAIHAGHSHGHSHPKPGKIVHVGHSFGSILTYGVSATYPDLSDGIVLTGYSMNSSFMPMFMAGANLQQARLNQSPGAFSNPGQNYTSGYLTNADMGNNEYMFLYPGNFDTNLLEYAEKNKQPLTVGELLTVSSVPTESKFTGPVLIITGSNDVPFCGGDCLNTGGASDSIPAAAKPAFPSAKAFSTVIQPNTAHGLNLHYNAPAGYKEIADFLENQDLMKQSAGVKLEISL
jgi:pimeloyl-ACP methyl ester carboxylesterase